MLIKEQIKWLKEYFIFSVTNFMESKPTKYTFITQEQHTFNTFLALKPMSCVLTVTSFQNLECTAWWLTVYKVTQNSTSSYRMTTTAFPTSRMHLLVKFRCYDYKNLDFMTKKKFTLFLTSIVKKYCFSLIFSHFVLLVLAISVSIYIDCIFFKIYFSF